MIRKLVSFSKEQDAELLALSQEMEISVAAVLRKILDEYTLKIKWEKERGKS